VLTVFSSIILPINLIASIYGMNFAHMPELQWRYGYVWAIGIMIVVGTLMLLWFGRAGWLPGKRRDVIRRERHAKRALLKKSVSSRA
jgi:magnesium transporter